MADSPVETRARYPHFVAIPTRWMDNDVYGHVNNVVYYAYFDTVINRYLIAEGGLDIARGAAIGLCVESRCRYRKAIAFPTDVDAGLRVSKLGRSSVTYEIGIFVRDDDAAAAEGSFVHVFVDRETRRATPIPDVIRVRGPRAARRGLKLCSIVGRFSPRVASGACAYRSDPRSDAGDSDMAGMNESCSVCGKGFEVQFRYQMEERDGAFSFFCSTACQSKTVCGEADGGATCDEAGSGSRWIWCRRSFG